MTELSKRKRAVFDRVVMAGETELRSLSEEDSARCSLAENGSFA